MSTMSNVGRTPYRSAFGNLNNHSRKLCITITQEVAPKKMLTCHEFTRSGHGLKHIEQYLLELPQMYEKTLGDSSVHCLRPRWHWSVVLSFFYSVSS